MAKTSNLDDEGPKTFFVNWEGHLAFDVGWVGEISGVELGLALSGSILVLALAVVTALRRS